MKLLIFSVLTVMSLTSVCWASPSEDSQDFEDIELTYIPKAPVANPYANFNYHAQQALPAITQKAFTQLAVIELRGYELPTRLAASLTAEQ